VSEHVPEDLLSAFVDGEMGEQLAIHIAEHLDSCPMCATRAVGMEPLGPAFASMGDPLVPDDLAGAILVAASAESPAPRVEIGIGVALLLSAVAVFVVLGEPVALTARAAIWIEALGSAGQAVLLGLPSPMVLLPITTVLGAASAMVFARLAWPDSALHLAGRRAR